MANVLTRIGWVDGQIVLAEDMLQFEENIEDAIRNHVHGDGNVVAVLPQNIPAPAGAVGNIGTVAAHLLNRSIHYQPNQNLPGWLWGDIDVPALQGDQPEWVSDDILLDPAFQTNAYKVFLSINYANATVNELPDSVEAVAEIVSAAAFRIHVRFVYNPFESHRSLTIVWIAVGAENASLLGLV